MFRLMLMLMLPFAEKEQATKDSLLIYNAYKDNITFLKTTNDYNRWYKLSDSLDMITAGAFHRLSLFNKEEYVPIASFSKEGFGEAFNFPLPSGQVEQEVSRASAFTIMDRQTKFIVRDNGKTRIPYIERLHFDSSHHLLRVDKVNPAMFFTEGLIVSVEE